MPGRRPYQWIMRGALCAWVLWAQSWATFSSSPLWRVQNAWETRGECEAHRVKELKRPIAPAQQGKVTIEDDHVVITLSPTERVFIYYVCLPETVDPREPKP